MSCYLARKAYFKIKSGIFSSLSYLLRLNKLSRKYDWIFFFKLYENLRICEVVFLVVIIVAVIINILVVTIVTFFFIDFAPFLLYSFELLIEFSLKLNVFSDKTVEISTQQEQFSRLWCWLNYCFLIIWSLIEIASAKMSIHFSYMNFARILIIQAHRRIR